MKGVKMNKEQFLSHAERVKKFLAYTLPIKNKLEAYLEKKGFLSFKVAQTTYGLMIELPNGNLLELKSVTDVFFQTYTVKLMSNSTENVLRYAIEYDNSEDLLKELGERKIEENGGNWRKQFNESRDAFEKSAILRRIAEISGSLGELNDILNVVKGMPEESNITHAVLHKKKALLNYELSKLKIENQ
jgi:hypothetical protein